MRPYFLTEQVAKEAVEMVMPAIRACIADGTFNRPHFHITIVAGPGPTEVVDRGFDAFTQDVVLYEVSEGDKKAWEYPFDRYARTKAHMSWLTGLDTMDLKNHPEMLRLGDTYYAGGINRNNVVVAVSAFKDYDDHLVAEWIAAAITAICRREYLKFVVSGQGFLEEKVVH